MKIGSIRRIMKENLQGGGELPGWIDSFLSPLNQFLETVSVALTQRLTFADNFLGKQVTQTFTHGVEREINPGTSVRVIGALPLTASGQMITGFKLSQKSNGNVGITFEFKAAGTTEASCTVFILYS